MNIPFIDRYIDPQYQHKWLVQGLIFLISYAVIYGLVRVFARFKDQPRFKWAVSAANAIFLTFFTVSCSGEFPLLVNTQTAFFSDLYRFQSLLHQNQSIGRFLGDNRLLVVDASHDLALVPDPSLNTSWTTNQLITNRQKLTRFLRLVAADTVNPMVDMVVCDLTFGAPSGANEDRALQSALTKLNSTNKLLIAKSKLDQSKNIDGQSAINIDSLAGGSVDIDTYYEGTFFSYRLCDTTRDGRPFGMAYELYCRLEKVKPVMARIPGFKGMWEPTAGGLCALVPNRFVPEFWFTNADVSRAVEPARTNWWDALLPRSSTNPDDTLQSAIGRLRPDFYYLGQLADSTDSSGIEQEGFLNQLRTNRSEGKRSIVFIGLFEDEERDTHQTLVGPMHGSILLLNVFVNLLVGSHRINLYYLLYLFAGFLVVSYTLMLPDNRRPCEENEESTGKLPSLRKVFIEEYNNLIRRIVDKQAYLLALILLLGAITFFNHLINVVVIGLYLALLKRMIGRLYYSEKT